MKSIKRYILHAQLQTHGYSHFTSSFCSKKKQQKKQDIAIGTLMQGKGHCMGRKHEIICNINNLQEQYTYRIWN